MKPNLSKPLTLLLILTICLISLGGAVRAMDAGLACPDWPLCFGQFIPDFHPQVYFEFIHRVLAGLVAILFFAISFLIIKNGTNSFVKKLIFFGGLILIIQIVMGGLTVLKLLNFKVVTTHLLLGTLFAAIVVLIKKSYSLMDFSYLNQDFPYFKKRFLRFQILLILLVFSQIFLGGLVSTNYAGLVCPDFPLCQGQWIPTLSGPVGLHVLHRLIAYFVFFIMVFNYFLVKHLNKKYFVPSKTVKISRGIITLVLIQICLGIANVVFQIPPIITVLHLANAIGIIIMLVLSSFYLFTIRSEENELV